MISNVSALDLARQAKASSKVLATASTSQRNSAILSIARIVREESIAIAGANVEDLAQARHNGRLPTASRPFVP